MAKVVRLGTDLLRFVCPACDRSHVVRIAGAGPQWMWNGSADRPTISPSIFVNRPGDLYSPASPSCHSFVRDGRIEFCGDSDHAMAGQAVELTEIPDEACVE